MKKNWYSQVARAYIPTDFLRFLIVLVLVRVLVLEKLFRQLKYAYEYDKNEFDPSKRMWEKRPLECIPCMDSKATK